MTRAALWPLIALAAFSCTDPGAVGRQRPKSAAATGGAGAAGQAGAACSQPPCAVLPCDPAVFWCPLCTRDDDCADEEREKLCNSATTLCVECRTHDDCPASRPFCDDGDCGQCVEDSDCPGELECDDAECHALRDRPAVYLRAAFALRQRRGDSERRAEWERGVV